MWIKAGKNNSHVTQHLMEAAARASLVLNLMIFRHRQSSPNPSSLCVKSAGDEKPLQEDPALTQPPSPPMSPRGPFPWPRCSQPLPGCPSQLPHVRAGFAEHCDLAGCNQVSLPRISPEFLGPPCFHGPGHRQGFGSGVCQTQCLLGTPWWDAQNSTRSFSTYHRPCIPC